MEKRIFNIVVLLFVFIFLIYSVHKVHANDGTASAEVLNDVLTINVTQDVNAGSFYPPRAGTGLVLFAVKSDSSIHVFNNIVPAGFSHRGGQSRGVIQFSGSPNTSINVTGPVGDVVMSGSSSRVKYRFRGIDSAFGSHIGTSNFNVQLDGNGNGIGYLLAEMRIDPGATPGSYSLTFPVNASY